MWVIRLRVTLQNWHWRLLVNPRLKSLAYRMLGSAADAEDIVQEAYLRLHQVQTPPDNEDAFLYRVVSNLCVDKLRHEKVRHLGDGSMPAHCRFCFVLVGASVWYQRRLEVAFFDRNLAIRV